LHYLYEKAEGTEKNLKKAFYWYQKQQKNGNIKHLNDIILQLKFSTLKT